MGGDIQPTNPHPGFTYVQTEGANSPEQVQTFTAAYTDNALLAESKTKSLLGELPDGVVDDIATKLADESSPEAKKVLVALAATNKKLYRQLGNPERSLQEIRSINDPYVLVSKTYSHPKAQQAQKEKLLDMLENGYEVDFNGGKQHLSSRAAIKQDATFDRLFTDHADEEIRNLAIQILIDSFATGFDFIQSALPPYADLHNTLTYDRFTVQGNRHPKMEISHCDFTPLALSVLFTHPDSRVVEAAANAMLGHPDSKDYEKREARQALEKLEEKQ